MDDKSSDKGETKEGNETDVDAACSFRAHEAGLGSAPDSTTRTRGENMQVLASHIDHYAV
jgi:hypothetical protein